MWIQIRRAIEENHLTHDWPKIAAGDENKRTTTGHERGDEFDRFDSFDVGADRLACLG